MLLLHSGSCVYWSRISSVIERCQFKARKQPTSFYNCHMIAVVHTHLIIAPERDCD